MEERLEEETQSMEDVEQVELVVRECYKYNFNYYYHYAIIAHIEKKDII